MNAPTANAMIFVRDTAMPAAAADRSFAPTASLAAPRRLRPRAAAPRPAGSSKATHNGAEGQVRIALTRPDAEIDAEELRCADRRTPQTAVPLRVAEPESLQRHGEGEGDDRDGQAEDPQRRQADDHADHRRGQGGQQRGE